MYPKYMLKYIHMHLVIGYHQPSCSCFITKGKYHCIINVIQTSNTIQTINLYSFRIDYLCIHHSYVSSYQSDYASSLITRYRSNNASCMDGLMHGMLTRYTNNNQRHIHLGCHLKDETSTKIYFSTYIQQSCQWGNKSSLTGQLTLVHLLSVGECKCVSKPGKSPIKVMMILRPHTHHCSTCCI
jgi:hypothetical protein